VRKGTLTEAKGRGAGPHQDQHLADSLAGTDLVIEAATENLESSCKHPAPDRRHRLPHTMIATNTSSISITQPGRRDRTGRTGSSACTSSTRCR
jgi:3-hydroxyacyl-CoA dehydrogenase